MDIDKVLDAYDDDDAIKFIQANLPDEAKQMFTDDDIQYFLTGPFSNAFSLIKYAAYRAGWDPGQSGDFLDL